MKNSSILLSLSFILIMTTSCISTKSTLKNVDNKAPSPKLTKENTFLITQFSNDKKYGYDPDYPINVFYQNTKDENLNAQRFLGVLAGPNGEKITFTKLESCCPFPTKRHEMGAGFLDVYELKWAGKSTPIKLYMNIYEKGYLMVPVGLSIKK